MALSGSRAFILTRDDIVKAALRKIGVTPQGGSLTNTQIVEAVHALNSMVQSWQSDGIYLWTAITDSINLSEGVSTYTLVSDASVIDVDELYVRDASGYDSPLSRMTIDEWALINVKNQKGKPYAVLVQRFVDRIDATLYYVPDSNGYTLYFTKYMRLQDFVTSGDNPDFPVEWSDALIYGLAYRLAPEYGITLDERVILQREAEIFRLMAKNSSSERGSLFISPYKGR